MKAHPSLEVASSDGRLTPRGNAMSSSAEETHPRIFGKWHSGELGSGQFIMPLHLPKIKFKTPHIEAMVAEYKNAMGDKSENEEGQDMSGPTREEIDAKLATVEARHEASFERLDGKLNIMLEKMSALDKSVTDKMNNLSTGVTEAKNAAESARVAAGNTKWNILFTGLAVAGVLVAIWAIFAQGLDLGINIGDRSVGLPEK